MNLQLVRGGYYDHSLLLSRVDYSGIFVSRNRQLNGNEPSPHLIFFLRFSSKLFSLFFEVGVFLLAFIMGLFLYTLKHIEAIFVNSITIYCWCSFPKVEGISRSIRSTTIGLRATTYLTAKQRAKGSYSF